MPTFSYEARNKSGKMVSGKITSETNQSAAKELISKGLTPIRIKLLNSTNANKKNISQSSPQAKKANQTSKQINKKSSKSILTMQIMGKVKTEELSMFCRQMHSLLKAGVPIYQGLGRIAETAANPLLKKALQYALEEIKSGNRLSDALRKYPKIFSSVFINVCRVGEETGNLHESFAYLSKYTTLESSNKKKVFAALRYPAIVFVAVTCAIIVLNVIVVPAFSKMYTNMHKELPLITRILIEVSDFIITKGIYVAIGIIATIALILFYIKTPSGRFLFDKYKLKVPIFGNIMFRIQLARFARIFSTMLKSGITVTSSMELVAYALDNKFLEMKLLSIRDQLQQGRSMTDACYDSKLFTPLTLQMIAVGEETASIDTMLTEVADFYDEDVDYDLSRLNQLMEPFLIVIMGGLVLVTALGMFLPMWNLAKING
jgi:MSHA biogenesis protein MshG